MHESCTMHNAQYILHCALCIVHDAPYIVQVGGSPQNFVGDPLKRT